MSFGVHKADAPCASYFGNACSGFGGSLTCMLCGWERHEHASEKERVRALFAGTLTATERQPASTREHSESASPNTRTAEEAERG